MAISKAFQNLEGCRNTASRRGRLDPKGYAPAAGASSLDKSTLEWQTGPRGVEGAGGTI